MGITEALVWSLGIFLTIHFLILPFLRKKLEGDRTAAAIVPFAHFHAFSMLRMVALAFALGSALLWAFLWFMGRMGTATVDELAKTVAMVRSVHDFAASVGTDTSVFLLIALTAGLAWLSYKQSKQKAMALFESLRQEEVERLLESYRNDQWEELPSNEMMQRVEAIFRDRSEKLEQAESDSDTASCESLRAEMDELRQLHFSLDLDRRVEPQLAQPLTQEFALPTTARWGDRLRNVFLNRGVLKSFQGLSRLVFFAALVALVPSVASVNLATGVRELGQRLLKLDEIRIEFSREEADRQLADSLNKRQTAPQPATIAAIDDQSAEDQLLDAYEGVFSQQLAARTLTTSARMVLERTALRERLLGDFAKSSHGIEALAGGEGASELKGPREKVREQLQIIRREKPAAWESLKSMLPSRVDFATPLARSEIRSALTSEIIRTSFSEMSPDLAASYDVHAKNFFAGSLEGGSLDAGSRRAFNHDHPPIWAAQTDQRLRSLQPQADSQGGFFDRTVRQSPPTLRARPAGEAEIAAVSRLLDRMPVSARSAQALFAYEDILPGRLGDEVRTPAAHTAERLGGGKGVLEPSRVHKPSVVAFERAYSYKALRGFSRVGGVLIGKLPEEENSRIDIRDISWSGAVGGALSLTLTDASGNKQTFGPFARSLIGQSLAYAADQRPLAVTMITADPVPDLKIIAHPALIDTPLGCRAVWLDRFADEATSSSPYRRQAEAAARAVHALYRYAWAVVMERRINTESMSASDKEVLRGLARRTVLEVRRELNTDVAASMEAAAVMKESPVITKTGFYDKGVAAAATRCAQQGKTLEQFQGCVEKSSVSSSVDALLKHIPEFQIWSGVRELPYTLDNNLNFLRPQAGKPLWPFDFVLQTAFTRQGLIGDDEVSDETPWEFPTLHARLVDDVGGLVQRNPTRNAVLKDMRDFVVVQRLFRLALNGQMGDRFPVDKLARLSAELNKGRAPDSGYRTPRWNARPIEMMFALNLAQLAQHPEIQNEATRRLARAAATRFDTCARANAGGRGQAECHLDGLQNDAEQLEEKLPESSIDRELAQLVRKDVGVLSLRRTLRVNAPENAASGACPAL